MGNIFSLRQENFSKKIGVFLIAGFFTIVLTACGQKGALYLPKDTASEMPTQTDNANNPNDLSTIQNPNQITPAINPNAQNPNIKIQDTKHDY